MRAASTRWSSADLHERQSDQGDLHTTMKKVIQKDRLTQLRELLKVLAEAIDEKPGARDLAQLSRQYRETLKEIEEIKGTEDNNDDISEILSERETNGKAGAVR